MAFLLFRLNNAQAIDPIVKGVMIVTDLEFIKKLQRRSNERLCLA
jgi:phosphoribulokinase